MWSPNLLLSAIQLFLLFSVMHGARNKVSDYNDDTGTENVSYHSIVRRPLRPQPSPSGSGSRYLRRRRPNQRHMDRSFLMTLMGDDFQTSWMSDVEPNKHRIPITSNEVTAADMPERWAADRLFQQLQRLNITEELSSEPELSDNPKIQMAIRSWLLKRASCPIEFAWQDLGSTFWPRWVRKGDCVDKAGTCSWPPGMHCVPAATTTVHLLRWQCKERKRRVRVAPLKKNAPVASEFVYRRKPVPSITEHKRKKKKCEWFRVPFPITIDCFCTC